MNENSPAEYFHRGNLPPIKRIYSQAELDQTPWYYSVEMEPGKLTSGQTFSNVALTRTLLQRTDLEGKDCLDIGTMEGLVPTLMKRRGALVAYDRPSALTSRIEAVKDKFGVDFEFVSGVPLGGLAARLNHRTFDVVVMSGVLYHLFSPLSGLAFARGLLRNGGIMILETAAVIDDTPAMHWNANLRFFGEAYFFHRSRALIILSDFYVWKLSIAPILKRTASMGYEPRALRFHAGQSTIPRVRPPIRSFRARFTPKRTLPNI